MLDRRNPRLFFAAVIISFPVHAAPSFQEGIRETEYRMEASGLPFAMPVIGYTKSACLTASNYIPDASQSGQECKVTRSSVDANTLTWALYCQAREGAIDGQGKVSFHDDRLEGTIEATMMSAASPGTSLRYRYTLNGKRVGSCAK